MSNLYGYNIHVCSVYPVGTSVRSTSNHGWSPLRGEQLRADERTGGTEEAGLLRERSEADQTDTRTHVVALRDSSSFSEQLPDVEQLPEDSTSTTPSDRTCTIDKLSDASDGRRLRV